jgi:hypothetical protein
VLVTREEFVDSMTIENHGRGIVKESVSSIPEEIKRNVWKTSSNVPEARSSPFATALIRPPKTSSLLK